MRPPGGCTLTWMCRARPGEAAAVDGSHAVLLGLRTSKAYARNAVTAQAKMTTAIGTGPRLPTQPTAALASTPNADWVAPRSDDAAPARSPKGAIATEVAFEAMKPMLPTMRKIGINTPQKPKSPLAAQTRSSAVAAVSP